MDSQNEGPGGQTRADHRQREGMETMAAQAPWQEEAEEVPVKTWMTSKWRRIMLIVIALDLIPVIYGAIILFRAADKARGFGNLLEYGNPALWITGAVIAGHAILFIGAVGLLMNVEWGTESVKIGTGIVFVFQCLAIAIAAASWIGDMFAVGQGRYYDANGEPMMMTGPVITTISLTRFLNPRIFATTWLSIAQMITLMVGIEKEKKDLRPLPNAKGKEESEITDGHASGYLALYSAREAKSSVPFMLDFFCALVYMMCGWWYCYHKGVVLTAKGDGERGVIYMRVALFLGPVCFLILLLVLWIFVL